MYYLDVIVENNSKHTDEPFTYASEESYLPGQVVRVPFGKRTKAIRGFVLGEGTKPSIPENRIKKIEGLDPDISLTEEMMETACWMKTRYGIRYMDGIKCFLPPGEPPKRKSGELPQDSMPEEPQTIRALTDEQEEAVRQICSSIENSRRETFLLHGVTGSGKTEVYMQAIDLCLSKGKTAVMLVPEIALTKQIIERFIGRFGREDIAILHSKLTRRQRYIQWQRIRSGEARIVIGARLAAFAPVEDLGLVIMDEEHESTYKSDQTPKYDTVDVVTKRLMYHKGVLILGSATPSVVSYSRAQDGIYRLVEMNHRYNQTPLPKVELVDMKEELKAGNRSLFSAYLTDQIQRTLNKGRQVILFLNRRGYAPCITCENCGQTLKCPDCGISLVYHKAENAAVCHYCGRKYPLPNQCPSCGERSLRKLGAGTEKIEELTRQLFPEAAAERLDMDTAGNRGNIDGILNRFSKGKTRILIGTQLVAKGLDFRNVGLVGVMSADSSLNIPDYRSTERTYQLITQVAGRAGRGEEKGLVIVQTQVPEAFVLEKARENDYKGFYKREMELRSMMDYPPFSDLISVEFTSEDEELAIQSAGSCKQYLCKADIPGSDKILGPKISWNFKGNDSYRYNILIKSPKENRNEYIYYLMYYSSRMTDKNMNCNMTIDVNPYSSV